jgi:hypothetical protein
VSSGEKIGAVRKKTGMVRPIPEQAQWYPGIW